MPLAQTPLVPYGAAASGSVAVVSRFRPWRARFHAEAPSMTPAVRRVDEEPRLRALWERRFPDG